MHSNGVLPCAFCWQQKAAFPVRRPRVCEPAVSCSTAPPGGCRAAWGRVSPQSFQLLTTAAWDGQRPSAQPSVGRRGPGWGWGPGHGQEAGSCRTAEHAWITARCCTQGWGLPRSLPAQTVLGWYVTSSVLM